MDACDPYGGVTSRYYDDTYATLRTPVGDVEFYVNQARAASGSVLELGCGSGRVLLPVSRLGKPCVGLDASADMLAALRARGVPPNLRLVHGPMQALDLAGERFAFIYSAFRAFQHLETVNDQLATLERARAHLSDQGVLALDVFAPHYDILARPTGEETEDARFERHGATVTRHTAVTEHDAARQLIRVRFRYERTAADGSISSETAEATMRYTFRFELEHLLRRAGFSSVTLHGAFDGRPYDYVSGEIVAVARP